ncbi:MAG: DUF3006 domain-containing protein [Halobacteriota archaeon]
MEPGTYVAVLDRFEGDLAVLLLERDGETVDDISVPRAVLPADGRHPDAVFDFTVSPNRTTLEYDPEAGTERLDAARDRFERLARRPPSATSNTDESTLDTEEVDDDVSDETN